MKNKIIAKYWNVIFPLCLSIFLNFLPTNKTKINAIHSDKVIQHFWGCDLPWIVTIFAIFPAIEASFAVALGQWGRLILIVQRPVAQRGRFVAMTRGAPEFPVGDLAIHLASFGDPVGQYALGLNPSPWCGSVGHSIPWAVCQNAITMLAISGHSAIGQRCSVSKPAWPGLVTTKICSVFALSQHRQRPFTKRKYPWWWPSFCSWGSNLIKRWGMSRSVQGALSASNKGFHYFIHYQETIFALRYQV